MVALSVDGKPGRYFNLKKIKKLSLILICILLVSVIPFVFGQEQTEWTFIFYLDADNNLGVYAEEDLAEMLNVGVLSNVNVVVLYDTFEGPVHAYLVQDGNLVLLDEFSLDGDEVDMGDPYTVKTFLDYVMYNYEASRYFLTIWDHGDDFRGSCRDEHTNNPEEERGFLYHSELQPILKDKDIDILAFDACIQGMIEVAYYYKDTADILIGSEDYVSYHGFPYDKILEKMEASPDISNDELAEYVADKYVGAYIKENGRGGGGYVEAFPTLSVIKLEKVDNIIASLNELTIGLVDNVKDYHGLITSARAKSIMAMPMFGWDADIDLYTFAEKIRNSVPDEEISDKANSLMETIDEAVYMNCSYQLSRMLAHGLGIFFPSSSGSINHNPWLYGEYYQNSVSFAQETEWLSFLLEYYEMK